MRISCDASTLDQDDFERGIDWVKNNRVLPAVASVSISGGDGDTKTKFNNMVNADVFGVKSAGNDSVDASLNNLASASGAFVVAAMNSDHTRRPSSNFGSTVDVFAPSWVAAVRTSGNVECCFGGTSAATPFVSGVAALMMEQGGAYISLRDAIIETATTGKISSSSLNGSPNRLLYSRGLWMQQIVGTGIFQYDEEEAELYDEGNHTFSADDLIGGDGSYTYTWNLAEDDGGEGEFGDFNFVSSSASYTRNISEDDPDIQLELEVTSDGQTVVHYLTIFMCWNHAGISCSS